MFELFETIREQLTQVEITQKENISKAAQLISESLLNDGIWHVFGTGHSHFIAEELYFRAGGLAPVNAILFPALMQHEGPITSMKLERLHGLAQIIFDREHITPKDVLMIISTSGKNPVPVEMAQIAQRKGIKTIALTSLAQSKAASYSPGLDKKLYEICDLVIDTCGVEGDAALTIPGTNLRTGATSSIIGIAIVEQLVYMVCSEFVKNGKKPPIFKSANLPGGDEWNAKIIDQFKERTKLR